MEIKVIPKEFMKYLDESVLLGAFMELLRREDAEIILHMQNEIMGTIAFSDKPDVRKLIK